MAIRKIYLPSLDALFYNYTDQPISYIRQQWYLHYNAINLAKYMGGSDEEKDNRTKSWYYLMVLTEIMRCRGYWDHKTSRPKEHFWTEDYYE